MAKFIEVTARNSKGEAVLINLDCVMGISAVEVEMAPDYCTLTLSNGDSLNVTDSYSRLRAQVLNSEEG